MEGQGGCHGKDHDSDNGFVETADQTDDGADQYGDDKKADKD